MKTHIAAAVTLAALALPAAAVASAQPISPPAGGSAGAHPVFTWALPAGESADSITLASKPDTTPEGEFFTENTVDFDSLNETDTTWQPTSPLNAGSYWWMVTTTTDDPFTVVHMPPSGFLVPVAARITKVKLVRDTAIHWLEATVGFSTNTKTTTVVMRVKRGARVLWTHADDSAFGESFATWRKPVRVKQGTRLVLVVTLKANATTKTVSRPFRAP